MGCRNLTPKLKAPFPYFGGKSRVASAIWDRFGAVKNYVEPFAGSCAVLLGNPHYPRDTPIETVNDMDGYLCNFWRAVRVEPDAVAYHAYNPVNELDLHARHRWLIERKPEFAERMRNDPDLYDVKMAGWWVWGISCWIGDNWARENPMNATPNSGHSQGVNCGAKKFPKMAWPERGCLSGQFQLPAIVDPARGCNQPHIYQWFADLSNRFRRVRVCCGDWARICTPGITTGLGLTAVFLDPPYADEKRDAVYGHDSFTVAHDGRKWCVENGNNPLLRIALCGYDEHHELQDNGWTLFRWKANGGYGNQSEVKNTNGDRETIFFSPHCVGKGLFE